MIRAILIVLAYTGAPDPGLLMGPAAEVEESGCVACHQVQADPRLARPVREARQGVHFQKGIFCEGCHGGDPTAPDAAGAKRADAGYVGAGGRFGDPVHICGRCHERVARVWRESGHNAEGGSKKSEVGGRRSEAAGRTASCVTCHGHHGVKKASTDLINPKNCAGCHGFPESNALKTYIYQNAAAIHSTIEQIKKLRAGGGGAFTEQAEVETIWGPARDIFHMTDRERVRRVSSHIRDEAAKVSGRAKWIENGYRYRTRVRLVWAGMAAVAAFIGACHLTVAIRMKTMIKR